MEAITNTYHGTGSNQLKAVTAHEIGHALGLDHNENEVSCTIGTKAQAVMRSGMLKWTSACKVIVPQTDDANGVNVIY